MLQRGTNEKIDSAVDNDFSEVRGLRLDGLNGATGGEFQGGAEADLVKFGGRDPTETSGSGLC